jgi:hypothetical protein
MRNIAIFISGRLSGYEENLIPFVNSLKDRYNIKLFFSINSFTIADNDISSVITKLEKDFENIIGYYNFEKYKLPRYFVENRLKNKENLRLINGDKFSYKSCSQFYNDTKNFELIELYEKMNNIKFDIICKTRADTVFYTNVDFIFNNYEDLILHNKHIIPIRYWGHIHYDTPIMLSDIFAYGNKNTMRIYCSTYEWILKNELESIYSNANEIYLTDNILHYRFYKCTGGDGDPCLSRNEIIDKYENNPNNIQIHTIENVQYDLLSTEIRHKNQLVIIDESNIEEYTESLL